MLKSLLAAAAILASASPSDPVPALARHALVLAIVNPSAVTIPAAVLISETNQVGGGRVIWQPYGARDLASAVGYGYRR